MAALQEWWLEAFLGVVLCTAVGYDRGVAFCFEAVSDRRDFLDPKSSEFSFIACMVLVGYPRPDHAIALRVEALFLPKPVVGRGLDPLEGRKEPEK